jgi:hypothetical protein
LVYQLGFIRNIIIIIKALLLLLLVDWFIQSHHHRLHRRIPFRDGCHRHRHRRRQPIMALLLLLLLLLQLLLLLLLLLLQLKQWLTKRLPRKWSESRLNEKLESTSCRVVSHFHIFVLVVFMLLEKPLLLFSNSHCTLSHCTLSHLLIKHNTHIHA